MHWLFLLCLLIISPLSSAYKPTHLTLWHALEGPLGEAFQKIVNDFNHQSGAYRVILHKKKSYKEIYETGLNAYLERNQPHILQVYEIATLNAMQAPNFFKLVGDLINSFHKTFDPAVYVDIIRDFYCNPRGKMLALPWVVSTGVLFYNKQAFAEAGLDPNVPPKTWEELEAYATKLAAKGYVGFTTTRPDHYFERMCTWHNWPFATHSNGFEGLSARLCFNQSPQIHHITKLAEWQKKGLYLYAGRSYEEPEQLFLEKKCAILLGETSRLSFLQERADFKLGVGCIPYWKECTAEPHNLAILGSSFWVFSGFTEREYRGIVQFFHYLSSAEVQAYWHQTTGYLPITEAGYYLSKKNGFYDSHPFLEIPILQLLSKRSTPHTRSVRLGNYTKVRALIATYLEKALTNQLPTQEALERAVNEGNKLLEIYQANAR